MAIAETWRLIEQLALEIPVRRLIVNHVSAENGACLFCDERRQEQRGLLQECGRAFPELTIFHLRERPHQIKGFDRLRELQFPVQWFSELVGAQANRSLP